MELVEYGLYRNAKYYGKPYRKSSFSLYQKYSYEDVCRLLEWEKAAFKNGDNLDTVLHRVDERLYLAKKLGKNRVE